MALLDSLQRRPRGDAGERCHANCRSQGAGVVICRVAVGQNQWYHFGVSARPILVYFTRDWDVHWGYGILTHGQVAEAGSVLNPCDISAVEEVVYL